MHCVWRGNEGWPLQGRCGDPAVKSTLSPDKGLKSFDWHYASDFNQSRGRIEVHEGGRSILLPSKGEPSFIGWIFSFP